MPQPPVERLLSVIDHLSVLGEDGEVRLIVDRIVNPSGHWVLTVATGGDEELLQMHTRESPDGPQSPASGHRVTVDVAGERVAEIDGEVIRLWGCIDEGPVR
jgi:hypothetical protein